MPWPSTFFAAPRMSWLNNFGFGLRSVSYSAIDSSSTIAQGPDDDILAPGQEFAQFGALSFQRVPGVTKTEFGYTHGYLHNPTYQDVCTGTTNHSEVVRVQYDPKECSFEALLDVFWARHDPTTLNRQDVTKTEVGYTHGYLHNPTYQDVCTGTKNHSEVDQVQYDPKKCSFKALLDVFWARHDPTTLNRQGNDVGTQYRSGIYFYTHEQEKAAIESKDWQKLKNCHRDNSGQEILPSREVSPAVPCKRWPIWFPAIKRERVQRPNSMLWRRITIHYYTT